MDNQSRTPLAYGKVGPGTVLTSHLIVTRSTKSLSQHSNNTQIRLRRSESVVSPRMDDFIMMPLKVGQKEFK